MVKDLKVVKSQRKKEETNYYDKLKRPVAFRALFLYYGFMKKFFLTTLVLSSLVFAGCLSTVEDSGVTGMKVYQGGDMYYFQPDYAERILNVTLTENDTGEVVEGDTELLFTVAEKDGASFDDLSEDIQEIHSMVDEIMILLLTEPPV